VEGARLVTSAQEVLEGLGLSVIASPAPSAVAEPSADSADTALLQALGFEPVSFDALQMRCGWPTDRLQARLFELELQGQLAHLPGGRWQRLVYT
jgi:DNA processing protein